MKKITLSLILIFFLKLLCAYSETDSLETALKNLEGKQKVDVLIELSEKYLPQHPDSALKYSEEALRISKKDKFRELECLTMKIMGTAYIYNWEYGKADSILSEGLKLAEKRKLKHLYSGFHCELGKNFDYQDDYTNALLHYKKAEQLLIQTDQLSDLAGINKNIGNIYLDTCEYEKAEKYYEQSLSVYEELDDKQSCASVLNNLGCLFYKQNDYEAALEKYLQALKIREELNDPHSEAFCVYNIGNFYLMYSDYQSALKYLNKSIEIFHTYNDDNMLMKNYNSLGIAYRRNGEFQKAIDFYTKALGVSARLKNTTVTSKTLNNIAVLYEETSEPGKALSYYQQALELKRKSQNRLGEITCLNNIGSLYILLKEADKAINVLTEAKQLLKEDDDPNLLMNIATGMSNAYSQKKDFEKSLEYFKLSTALNDSLNSVETASAINEIQTKYETEKKVKAIELLTRDGEIKSLKLTKQKTHLRILILIVALLIIFSYIIYRIKQNEIQTQKKVEAEIKKLNAELEHRVQEELKKRERQQQQLIQKSKLESIGKLAAGIAHEINQPLGGISMGLENIYFAHSEGRLSDKYLEEKLEQIDGYFERIKQIIEHIRIFSRDQKSVLFEDVDINQTVKDALSLLQTQFKNHNVELKTELSEDIPPISGNKFKLEQVVLNLLTNAKDAVEEKAVNTESTFQKNIVIRSFFDEQNIYLEIEDNGKGILPEDLKKIFDPFFTTKEPDKGTGLGLSIIYGIIKEMNGEIDVESEVGEFTKMKILFRR